MSHQLRHSEDLFMLEKYDRVADSEGEVYVKLPNGYFCAMSTGYLNTPHAVDAKGPVVHLLPGEKAEDHV